MSERYELLEGERRFDQLELRPAETTPEGFLDVELFATRTGIFDYEQPDGSIRRELRHPDEVFAPESLASLRHAVFTNKHPPELVNRDNSPAYVVGYLIGEPQVVLNEQSELDEDEVQDGRIKTKARITDGRAIDDIVKGGRRETSAGYTADVLIQPGIYKGERYDAVQTNIRYNHVAGVDVGRAGPEVRLRVDSSDDDNQQENAMSDETKTSVEIKGVRYDLKPAVAQAVAGLKSDHEELKEQLVMKDGTTFQEGYDAMKQERDALMKEREKMQGQIDTLTEELDTFKKKKDQEGEEDEEEMDGEGEEDKNDSIDPKLLQAAVQDRVTLFAVAKHVKLDTSDIDLSATTNRQLRNAIIQHRFPTVKFDSASEDYLTGRFESLVEAIDLTEEAKLDGLRSLASMFPTPKTPDPERLDGAGGFDAAHKSARDEYLKQLQGGDRPLSEQQA